MGNACGQFANRSKLVRLGHQLVLALAFGNIAQENERAINFPVFPQRRRVRLGMANRAVEAGKAYLMLSVIAFQGATQILIAEFARVGRNNLQETTAGGRWESVVLGPLIHPGNSAGDVQRIDLVGSAIGNTCKKRLVGDCFSLGASEIRDISSDDDGSRLQIVAR